MTTTPEAARLAEEARKLAAKLRTPEVFHTQVSKEWEEYATVERTRGPSHDAIYTADLLDALAALSQPDEARDARWRPIDSAPKDGTNVLLVNRRGNMATGLWQGEGQFAGWWLRGGNGPNVFFNDHHGPTHWMPLPDAPDAAMSKEQP